MTAVPIAGSFAIVLAYAGAEFVVFLAISVE
jgi:hypothetical protein